MSESTWFSGSCLRVCIIEGEGIVSREESVYVFRSTTREAAIERLLELARQQDKVYLNNEGKRVRWALHSLETVDELDGHPLGDREVFSRISDLEQPDASVKFDARFQPEQSQPGKSGVPPW